MGALVALAAAAALAGAGGPTMRVPAKDVASVALVGSRVAWVRSVERPEVYVDRKLVWRAPVVAVPAAEPRDAHVVQSATVSASATTVAVLRTATVIEEPPCAHAIPPCLEAP